MRMDLAIVMIIVGASVKIDGKSTVNLRCLAAGSEIAGEAPAKSSVAG